VFIGSASEGLEIANTLQVLLERFCDTQVWPQGLFAPGRSYLESLVRELPAYDFAVLVITPDDKVESRGELSSGPRDNILFELGLFMGRLGRDRTFAVFDRTRPFKLPSDFAGIKLIDYEPSRIGLEAALGAASTKIINAIKRAPPRKEETDRRLEELQQTVIAAGESGPDEQAYFDKLSQVIKASGTSDLALLYADIDGLRSMTRKLFLAEKDHRRAPGTNPGRRPEADMRADFVRALNVSITDAVYQLHPDGLKHDIFALPDPDVAVIARKLPYQRALQVAERARAAFREEAGQLLGPATQESDVTLLVSSPSILDAELVAKGSAEIHRFLRGHLKHLKDKMGRGRIYGQDALTQ
jgi:hypothetical protein